MLTNSKTITLTIEVGKLERWESQNVNFEIDMRNI